MEGSGKLSFGEKKNLEDLNNWVLKLTELRGTKGFNLLCLPQKGTMGGRNTEVDIDSNVRRNLVTLRVICVMGRLRRRACVSPEGFKPRPKSHEAGRG